MRLIVLGSGTNLHPKRAAAGYLVETDHLCLFDFGPRTLMNLVKIGVDRHHLQHFFFSHYHADHFSDFITFFFDAVIHATLVGPRPPLTIYGPRGTRRLFMTILKEFPSFSPTPFAVRIKELTDQTIQLGETRITAGSVGPSAEPQENRCVLAHRRRAGAIGTGGILIPARAPAKLVVLIGQAEDLDEAGQAGRSHGVFHLIINRYKILDHPDQNGAGR